MSKFIGRDIKIGIGKEKITGTPTSVTANKLNDSGTPFSAGMVGAQVVKVGSPVAYTYVTEFNSTSQLTLNEDIFTTTAQGYEVANRGTPIAPKYWIPRRSFDFEDKILTVRDEQGYGVIEDGVAQRVVSKWAEGSLVGVVKDQAIGLLLLNVLGRIKSSTPYTGSDDEVYKHTFAVRSNHQHPSITLGVKDDLESLSHPLCMMKSLMISAETGEMVLFTMDAISKKGVTSSPVLVPAYTAENDFAAGDITTKFATDTSALGTATAIKVRSVEISIEQDIEKDDVLSSTDPDDLLNKMFRVNVTVTKVYDSNTFKGYFTGGTSKAMRITIENMNSVLQTGGSKYPKLEFDFNKVDFVEWVTAKDLDEVVTETLTLRAAFKIADGEMIEATLENLATHY